MIFKTIKLSEISGCLKFRLPFHAVGLSCKWISEGINCVKFMFEK